MCLAAFAFGVSDTYPMVFAANRDELHARPTAAADWWADHPRILGGRDLRAGGTWLAVDTRGRLAAVTNVPPRQGRTYPKSRGHLVRDYLAGESSAEEFLSRLGTERAEYGPFNLLIFDGGEFHYFSDQGPPRRLSPGTYALSNAPLGTAWPKVRFAESSLGATLAAANPVAHLLEMLGNRDAHGSDTEPDTERRNRVFIEDERFGTRASTVVVVSGKREVQFLERRFGSDGGHAGESGYRFKLDPADALGATR